MTTPPLQKRSLLPASSSVTPIPMVPLKNCRGRRGFVLGGVTVLLMAVGGGVVTGKAIKPAPQVAVATPAPQSSAPPTSDGIALNASSLAPPEEVARHLEDAAALKPASKPQAVKVGAAPSTALLLREAQAALKAKDYAKAQRRYDQVLIEDPENAAALQGKIYGLEQSGAALPTLQALAAAHPRFAPAHAALARALGKQGDEAGALKAWQEAVALDAANPSIRLGLATAYDRLGQRDKALEAYRALPEPWTPEIAQRIAYLAGQR